MSGDIVSRRNPVRGQTHSVALRPDPWIDVCECEIRWTGFEKPRIAEHKVIPTRLGKVNDVIAVFVTQSDDMLTREQVGSLLQFKVYA